MRKNRPQSDPPKREFTALDEMFVTIDPRIFRLVVENLSRLYDFDKPGFNLVLAKFQEYKDKPMDDINFNHIVKKHILKQELQNLTLSLILHTYWTDLVNRGGYLRQLLPQHRLEGESEEQFRQRVLKVMCLLKELSLLFVTDCGFFERNDASDGCRPKWEQRADDILKRFGI